MLIKCENLSFKEYSESGYKMTEEEIDKKYQDGELRIITEQGRYPLQNIIDILSKNIKFDPEYQRRRVWTNVQKSRLIESFIINVPIPPVFLYEIDFSKYEVMDGLQRLSTIYDYYTDKFKLEGLEVWSELNDMTYSQLPNKVKSGIDRRYISTIVILKETAKDSEEEQILKKFVFERLNTGGTKLTDQETRNALYNGPMNQLCMKIADECSDLHKLWNIAPFKPADLIKQANLENAEDEDYGETDDENLNKNIKTYIRMEDVELVLRFFAYRQLEENPATKVKDILDLYLKEANKQYDDNTINELETIYYKVLYLADKVFNVKAFSMYTKKKNGEYSWNKSPSKLVYDPILNALSDYIDNVDMERILVNYKDEVIKKIEEMFVNNTKDFNGRNNNKSDVIRRKAFYKGIFDSVIQEHANE